MSETEGGGTYRIIDDESVSDVGFEAWSQTLEGLFRASWDATLSLMIGDVNAVRREDRRRVSCDDHDLEMLLFDFLGELIYLKDAHRSLCRIESLAVEPVDSGYRLTATVAGEEIDPTRHDLGVDIKAVTLDQLTLRRDGDRYLARVSLDA